MTDGWTYKGGRIEKLEADDAESFYPPKFYIAIFPEGKTDGHGATTAYTRTLDEARVAITNAKSGQ